MPILSDLMAILGKRASLENPRTSLADPDAWLYEAFGAGPALSGVRINRETAHNIAAVRRAVTLIAGDVGKLPLYVYRRTGRGQERDPSHIAYNLIRHKANSEMLAVTFRETLQGHALGDGNGYGYIFRNGAGQPLELIPLSPTVTYPVRVNGVLWYVTKIQNETRRLIPSNVIHIKGFGDDGLIGHNVWQKARDSLGLSRAASDFGSRFFANDATPGVILEHPGKLKDEAVARLLQSWNQLHQGLEGAHRTGILEEGMKAHVLGISARDAQLLELRQFEIREISNWFGLPPHKLGDSSRTAYNSLEQENLSYLTEALDTWLVKWEEEFRDKLLSEEEKRTDSHTIEFLRNALMRADAAARGTYFRAALAGAPWMTPNEVRRVESMNELDDPRGDELLVPLNLSATGGPPDADPTTAPAPKPAAVASSPHAPANAEIVAAQRTILERDIHRMVHRLRIRAERAARKPAEFAAWLDSFADEQERILFDSLIPSVTPLALARGESASRLTDELIEALCERVRSAADAAYSRGPAETFASRLSSQLAALEGNSGLIHDLSSLSGVSAPAPSPQPLTPNAQEPSHAAPQ